MLSRPNKREKTMNAVSTCLVLGRLRNPEMTDVLGGDGGITLEPWLQYLAAVSLLECHDSESVNQYSKMACLGEWHHPPHGECAMKLNVCRAWDVRGFFSYFRQYLDVKVGRK